MNLLDRDQIRVLFEDLSEEPQPWSLRVMTFPMTGSTTE
jgi:hypothetical protein